MRRGDYRAVGVVEREGDIGFLLDGGVDPGVVDGERG